MPRASRRAPRDCSPTAFEAGTPRPRASSPRPRRLLRALPCRQSPLHRGRRFFPCPLLLQRSRRLLLLLAVRRSQVRPLCWTFRQGPHPPARHHHHLRPLPTPEQPTLRHFCAQRRKRRCDRSSHRGCRRDGRSGPFEHPLLLPPAVYLGDRRHWKRAAGGQDCVSPVLRHHRQMPRATAPAVSGCEAGRKTKTPSGRRRERQARREPRCCSCGEPPLPQPARPRVSWRRAGVISKRR